MELIHVYGGGGNQGINTCVWGKGDPAISTCVWRRGNQGINMCVYVGGTRSNTCGCGGRTKYYLCVWEGDKELIHICEGSKDLMHICVGDKGINKRK